MSVLDKAIAAKRKMDAAGKPLTCRGFHVYPAELYQLCSELQPHLDVRSVEYADVQNCKIALANENWDIVRAAMPKQVVGMRLYLAGTK